VTVAAERLEEATLTRTVPAARFDQSHALAVPGLFRRAALVAGDVFGALAIVLGIPFVILAIGIPIAVCVRVLLWMAGLVL